MIQKYYADSWRGKATAQGYKVVPCVCNDSQFPSALIAESQC